MANEYIGAIPTTGNLPVAVVQAGGRVYVSNGHCRPQVWDGRFWRPASLRPAMKAPIIDSTTGGGNVTGVWRFATQLWHKRGARSNLSPMSAATSALEGHQVGLSLNLKEEDLQDFDDPSNALVAVWAYKAGDDLKMVARVPWSQKTYVFNMLYESFAGIMAQDRVANVIGSLTEPISIGNDIIPSFKFGVEYNSRLCMFGQADYQHPGMITIVPNDQLTTYFSGLSSTERYRLFRTTDSTEFQNKYGSWGGAPRAMVVLSPTQIDPYEGKFWEHSDQIFIGVGPNRQYVDFVIHGIPVVRVTQNGDIVQVGTTSNQGPMSIPSRNSFIEWDASRDAILVNGDVGMSGPSSWKGCIVVDKNGNITFDRQTTVEENANSITGSGLWDAISLLVDLGLPQYVIEFIPTGLYGSGGKSNCYYVSADNKFYCTGTIHQNQALIGSYPLFDLGLIYKTFYSKGEYQGFVYDVTHPEVLWLDRDVEGEIQENVQNWKIEGLPFLFYTGFGNYEGGYYGVSVRNEGRGTFLYNEFQTGGLVRTPAGLYVDARGLNVVFEEGEFVVEFNSTQTPLPAGGYRVERKRTLATVIAPRSVAGESSGDQYALTTKPLGVSRLRSGISEPILDVMGSRKAITKRVERGSLKDAVGAFWTDDEGSAYVVGNLDKIGGSGGEHSLFIDLRNEPRLVSIDGMAISALTPILNDDGTQRLVYADRSGNLGFVFEEPTDNGSLIPWAVRIYLSPGEYRRLEIPRARIFAAADTNSSYGIAMTIWAVGAEAPEDDLLAEPPSYPGVTQIFSSNDIAAGKPLAMDPLDSTALLVELSGQQRQWVDLKGWQMWIIIHED